MSFGYTTPAVQARQKRRTRRHWSTKHLEQLLAMWRFQREQGRTLQLDAWNQSPRVRKYVDAHPIGIIELPTEPFVSNEYPDEDWEAEGFAFMQANDLMLPMPGATSRKLYTPEHVWETWRRERPTFTVIDFNIAELFE